MNILSHTDNPRLRSLIEAADPDREFRILFVCLGNICRSPAAEGMMIANVAAKSDPKMWELDSAGTGRYHIGDLPDYRMRQHAQRRGLTLTHRCRQVESDDFEHFDLIIGMDSSNIDNLRRMAPSVEGERKVVPMAWFFGKAGMHYDYVPDPYYEGPEGFELVLDLLTEATENLLDTVAETRKKM